MPKNGLNVSLNSYDDIFSTEETRQEEQREQVQQIPIDELYPFKDHPFKVLDDEAMQRTVESTLKGWSLNGYNSSMGICCTCSRCSSCRVSSVEKISS